MSEQIANKKKAGIEQSPVDDPVPRRFKSLGDLPGRHKKEDRGKSGKRGGPYLFFPLDGLEYPPRPYSWRRSQGLQPKPLSSLGHIGGTHGIHARKYHLLFIGKAIPIGKNYLLFFRGCDAG